jgi:hypothetical protein
MRLIETLILCIGLLLLSGCSGSEEGYTAVYQVIPDAHILYLGNHYFLAKDNDGQVFIIQVDGFGEASYVRRIY